MLIEVDSAWVKDNLEHAPWRVRATSAMIRRPGFSVPTAGGLEVDERSLANLIGERAAGHRVEPIAMHLLMTDSDDGEDRDPDREAVAREIRWLADGHLSWVRIAHLGHDSSGSTELQLRRRAGGAIAITERYGDQTTPTAIADDAEVATAMVLSWVRAYDA